MATTEAVEAPVIDKKAPTEDGGQELRRNAIGLKGAMMLGVVIMAPSLAILFNWGFMIPTVGRQTSILFVVSLLLTLPTAYSYALINRRMPSPGATYKWASRLISPEIGIATGLCTTLFYAFFIPTQPPFQAYLISDLISTTSTTVFAFLMAGTFLLAIPFIYRGVTFSLDTAIILVIAEVCILVVVAVGAFIASDDSKASLAPLDPGALPSVSVLMPALVLAYLTFTGYDAISTLAAETRTPRALIPRATMLSVTVVGLFWVLITLVLSDAISPDTYNASINAGGLPLGEAANTAFGDAGRIVIDIMGIEASFGLLIATVIGSTRILYAMGRDGVISRRFGRVHPKFKVPWFAITACLAFGVIVDVALAVYLSVSFDITLWAVNAIAFFALITYFVINVCNPLLHLRHFRSEFHWFSNGVVPLVGAAGVAWFMYKGFFDALWNLDWKLGKSIVVVSLILFAITLLVGWVLARRPAAREAAIAADESADGDELLVSAAEKAG